MWSLTSNSLMIMIFLLSLLKSGICENMTSKFNESDSLDASESVYFQLSQINYMKKTSLKIYFNDYHYVISEISAVYTSDRNENVYCATYKIGFKTSRENSQSTEWDMSITTQCNCLSSSTCEPPKIKIFKLGPHKPLEVEIEVFKESDYQSWANITLIPAIIADEDGSCKTGMKAYNYTSQESSILLCPVWFDQETVPLVSNGAILSLIGEKPGESLHWGVYIVIVLVLLLIAAVVTIVVYFFYIKPTRLDSEDGLRLISNDKDFLISRCNKKEMRRERNLSIYSIPLEDFKMRDTIYKRLDVEKLSRNLKKDEFTLMLVGLKDHGKNTLICALLNFLFGVEFRDNYRFELRKSNSSDSDIITYEIPATTDCNLGKVIVNIVDVPSFLPSDNNRNDRILDKIRHYNENGYFIDALCIIAKGENGSSNTMYDLYERLVGIIEASQVYLLNTFIHDGQAPITREFVDRKIIRSDAYSKKIKNEVLFEDSSHAYESDWASGIRSVKKFCEKIIDDQVSVASRISKKTNGVLCSERPVVNDLLTEYNIDLSLFESYYSSKMKSFRLLFVGYEGAGKKSFIDSLINMNYRLKYREMRGSNSSMLKLVDERPDNIVSHFRIPALVGSKLNFHLEIYDVKSFDHNSDNNPAIDKISALCGEKKIDVICFVLPTGQHLTDEFMSCYNRCHQTNFPVILVIISQTKKGHSVNTDKLQCDHKLKIKNFALVEPDKADADDLDHTVASFNVLFDDLTDRFEDQKTRNRTLSNFSSA